MIYQNGFSLSKLKMVKLGKEIVQEFYSEHRGKPFYENLCNFMSSDYAVGMEIVGSDIINSWRKFIGPTNSEKARQEAPHSVRALFGTDGTKNAVHGSDSPETAQREINFIFGKNNRAKNIPQLSNCSCLIIKPHIIAEGNAGKIIDIVLSQGFDISSMEMFYLDKTTAEEFFEVYKGVLPEYSAIIDQVTSGPIIAMEIRQDNVVESLRNLVGPHDPEIAKILRPNTIRSMFGKDRVKNGVHCTDLPEDGVLEVQYFFELLQEK
jgi:nucleoside-diphosphate kinase